MERAIPHGQPAPAFHRPMILLHDVIKIFALTQTTPPAKRPILFQLLDCGWICRVLIYVDNPRLNVALIRQHLAEEALGGSRVPLGGE